MSDCVFCKIIKGDITSAKVYEDEFVLVFADIAPAAPVHLLAVPKEHIENIDGLTEANADIMSRLFLAAKTAAKAKGISGAYRIIINNGSEAGQEVFHLHLHILGGKKMGDKANCAP